MGRKPLPTSSVLHHPGHRRGFGATTAMLSLKAKKRRFRLDPIHQYLAGLTKVVPGVVQKFCTQVSPAKKCAVNQRLLYSGMTL